MNSEIRIITHFSPLIEEELIKNGADNVLPMLKLSVDIIEKFKHTAILVFPSELLGLFNSNIKLRIILDKIYSNTQSNIFFQSINKYHNCVGDLSKMYNGFPISTCTHNFTNYITFKNKTGLLFDRYSFSYKKQACTPCEDGIDCSHSLFFTVYSLSNDINLTRDFEKIAGLKLESWKVERNKLTENDIKGLGFLQAILHGATEHEINAIAKYSITPQLVEELRNLDDRKLFDASFCMFRTCAYPSSQMPNHHKLSIDWHINNPNIIRPYKYKLFRVDVLPANRKGIGSSGVIRLLMAIKDAAYHFIMVTDDHDFCAKTIRERVAQLPQ